MKEQRDHEVERLLGEYRDDLRRQSPSSDLLARVQQEASLPNKQARKVLAFPSRRAMGGLALAASLLVMVAVFRSRPEAVAPPAKAVQEIAATPVPGGQPSASVAPVETETPPKLAKQIAKAKEIPSPRPAELPSMQAMTEPAAPRATTSPVPVLMAEAAAKASEATPESDKRAEAKRAEVPALTLVAVVVQEVWPPGQLARVTTGSYQRLPDGREIRSVLTPIEAPPVAQNSFGLAAPSQQQSLGQARRSSPLRDQMQEARGRIAAPQLTPLGEMVIEGYRCTGSRTVDGERSVERWRSAELGLDLLVLVTDAQGGQTVTRYTRIERR